VTAEVALTVAFTGMGPEVLCTHGGISVETGAGQTARLLGLNGADASNVAQWLASGAPGPAPSNQGFVAILVDRSRRNVVAACGARTELSLAYTRDANRLVLATGLPALLAHLSWRPQVDVGYVVDSFTAVGSARRALDVASPLAGVRRIPYGHLATITEDDVALSRWFRPSFPDSSVNTVARMREAIGLAVADSLPDSPIAVAMSGGLDSTTVAALAATSGRPVVGLCHVPVEGTPAPPGRRDLGDWHRAVATADHVPGLRAEPVINDAGVTMLDVLPAAFEETLSPVFNPASLVWFRLLSARAQSLGASVLLVGQQGNLTFSGPPAALLHRGRPWPRAKPVDRWTPAGIRSYTARRGVRETLKPAMDRLMVAGPPLPFSLPAYTPGLRMLDPLSDPRVATVALQTPRDQWTAGGLTRSVARRATIGLLPDAVRLHRGRGSQGADTAIHRRARQSEFRRAVQTVAESSLATSIVDTAVLSRSLTAKPEAANWDSAFGRVLGLGLYLAWAQGSLAAARPTCRSNGLT
jgi:hypothetical protein